VNGSLVFPDNWYAVLSDGMLASREESCAVLLAGRAEHNGQVRLLVREIHQAPENAYRKRSAVAAELKPEFIGPIIKRALRTNSVLVFCHTHPGASDYPVFSTIDDAGEIELRNYLAKRGVRGPHAALVMSPGGCQARIISTAHQLLVLEVGTSIRTVSTSTEHEFRKELFDRQIRAFGESGQKILASMKVGVVGLGGTGSVVAQQLAYLGVKRFLFIDFDRADETNLNRLVGAYHSQINELKVHIAAEHISRISQDSRIDAVEGSVLEERTTRRLLECDFIFCCTDNHGSRAVVQQMVYQYYLPCIDMGVVITPRDGKVAHIAARIQMLSPGLPCLTCGSLLDPDAVRYDLMSPDQRAADPYFLGHQAAPQPSVISLNSTAASLAVTMFLGAVTDIPAHARFQTYNAISGKARAISYSADPMCVVSSPNGALGKGDEWPLPVRR
jgi:molybdopterin-synthase adenylyltransferase